MSLDNRDYMRNEPRPAEGALFSRMDTFQWVFALNIGVFVIQWLFQIGWIEDPVTGRRVMPMGGVSVDDLARGQVWTPFTYMFVHGSVGHILVNMIMLWFAGRRVHDLFGGRNFLYIYLMSGLAGAALEMAQGALVLGSTSITLIGASACCMGLLLAYALAMPDEQLTLLLFFIIPVQATLRGMARFLLLLNVALGLLACFDALPSWLSGGGGAVAYWAHVGGALAGWYFARA
ncbi:MAG TPA: rhomboid family intramembrane serine protease, partial [Prosthecobacter sp.]|nr:rhomboid family intramembrane serine protease [Prosthecobacter sp.]